MTPREVSAVFSNIDSLYFIHVEILASLERLRQGQGDSESVGDIFMQIVCCPILAQSFFNEGLNLLLIAL